jgi:leader peptidase (prepilin peptidase) / N-methyltransferase
MTEALVWLYAALVGAMIGSFLNVCIARWPAEQSVIRPRSRCPSCGAGIRWYDNVPVLAWIWLRGACRSCGAPISVQYPIIELVSALIWLGAAIRFGPTIDALHSATFLTLLLGIAMTDAREMVIPDQFTLGGVVLGLAFALGPGGLGIADALIGGAVAYALFWAVKLIAEKLLKKPALGVGDIHMMAMVGAFLGLGGALLTIFLGSLLGLVIGVPAAWLRGKLTALNTYLPLGVFLAMGAAVAHLWGERIIDWYVGGVLGI